MKPLHAFTKTVAILGIAAALAVAVTFLPHREYLRFQQLDGTIYGTGRWLHERMHNDPRPIDVAIFGPSTTLIGLQPDRIAAQLAARGKRAQVVNMSLVGEGRNTQWILFQELLASKSPKVIVVAVSRQPYRWGHSTFRYFAPATEVWREAFLGLHDARKDLVYLPYRQLTLFGASLAPGLAGADSQFSPARYNPVQDNWTKARLTLDGKWFDPNARVSRAKLIQAREAVPRPHRSRLPAAVAAVWEADDRVYTDRMAREARRHGVKVIFVYIPGFHDPGALAARPYYEAIAPIQDNSDIVERDDLYMDIGHTNVVGSRIVSDRIAEAVAEKLP